MQKSIPTAVKDMADRTLSTFLETFVALELADMTNLTDLEATKAAALAALLATVKTSGQRFLKSRRRSQNV